MRRNLLIVVVLCVGLRPTDVAGQTPVLDPAARDKARELVSMVFTEAGYQAYLAEMGRAMAKIWLSTSGQTLSGDDQAAAAARIQAAIQRTMAGIYPREDWIDAVASIYANNLTLDDMEQAITFFSSPAGSRIAAVQGRMMAESSGVGEAFIAKRREQFVQRFQSELLRAPETGQDAASQGSPVQSSPRFPLAVDGKVIKPPQKLKNVNPEYPKNAMRVRLQGKVELEATIDTDGSVSDARILSGSRSLGAAAIAAVRQWKFTATLLNGVPVPVIMKVSTNFSYAGTPTEQDVLAAMGDADPEIRLAAVGWLGTYRPMKDKQRKAIGAALRDPSPEVQEAARKALESLEKK